MGYRTSNAAVAYDMQPSFVPEDPRAESPRIDPRERLRVVTGEGRQADHAVSHAFTRVIKTFCVLIALCFVVGAARIAIAGVIAMQPRCIVLDEPTAMLDPIGRAEVMKTIRELNRSSGVTVVLITHHMDEAAQADRLVVMAKGRVIADGAPKEIFQDVEGLKAVGLTVPETTQLLWELRREGLDVPLDALSDEECAQALKELLA